jgi:hypothetical protein
MPETTPIYGNARLTIGLIGNTPLQLLLFWDMQLQFVKLVYAIAVQPDAKIEWQISNIAPNCNGKFPYHSELQWQNSACGWIAMANFQLGGRYPILENCNDIFPINP